MRLVAIVLALLAVGLQWPLWFGEGGWLKVWERERKLEAQRTVNTELRARNAALEGEVKDLRDGTAAIEERARFELGMVKGDEIFVQVLDGASTKAPPATRQ
ncbi:MAG TPA: cell division protein FtsB [Burkholderiaceae bacterium]|nr:cell division protein FtsB [Burkholderiaceae bacterium]